VAWTGSPPDARLSGPGVAGSGTTGSLNETGGLIEAEGPGTVPMLMTMQFRNCAALSVKTFAPDASTHWYIVAPAGGIPAASVHNNSGRKTGAGHFILAAFLRSILPAS
jgi:hypothetical protein